MAYHWIRIGDSGVGSDHSVNWATTPAPIRAVSFYASSSVTFISF